MVLDHVQVLHKSFGEGVVIAQNGKYFTVKFSNVEKIFVYPDVFERFLTLADGGLNDEIRKDLAESKMQKEKVMEEKVEENRRAMEHGIVIPGKEITPEPKDDEGASSDSEE